MLRAEPFDLVILDIPTGGSEVLREVRSTPGLGQLPVLMVASQGEADAIGSCLEMGADDIVVEPFVPVVVRARINASLARKRLSDREVERTGEIWANHRDGHRRERGDPRGGQDRSNPSPLGPAWPAGQGPAPDRG